MIRAIILSLLLVGCSQVPMKPTQTRSITIEETDDAHERCQSTLGPPPYGRKYFGCASWVDSQCNVLLTNDYNNWMLGHEVRHCFEGYTHD